VGKTGRESKECEGREEGVGGRGEREGCVLLKQGLVKMEFN
jgi:hypothetical protein